MQPKTSFWNFLLFIVLSVTIMLGSAYLQNRFAPKPEEKQEQKEQAKDEKEKDKDKDKTDKSKVAETKKDDKQAEPAPKPTPPKVVQSTAPHKEFTIGDDTTRIKAVLTSRGAGVLSLTLNQFKAANYYGRPVDGQLELLGREANSNWASYALYSYEKAEDDRPVLTLGDLEWAAEDRSDAANRKWEVTFTADVPGLEAKISKTFTLAPDQYHLGLQVKMWHAGPSQDKVRLRYQLAGGHGMPLEGVWYNSTFGVALTGLLDERNRFTRDFQESRGIGHKGGGEAVLRGDGKRILYAGITIPFFASVTAVDNEQEKVDFLARSRATVESQTPPQREHLADLTMRVVSEPVELKPGDAPVVQKFLLYNGPVKVKLLGDDAAVEPELLTRYLDKIRLNTLTDYHVQGGGPFVWISENIMSPLGWTALLVSTTNLMHNVLYMLHKVIPNYGICIILLTFLVRGCLHPLSRRQALMSRDMQGKMKALRPELAKLKEKYKDDFRGFSQAQQELYRKHNVNPFAGLAGCLPVLIQMPIFMGLYYALQESVHFRLAPFLWIKNLAAPDMLVWWGESIPWISDVSNLGGMLYLGPYFNILPVLAVTLMLVQQVLTMPAPDPSDEQAVMQAKMMKYMMVFMGIMFYKVAAGLCVYFIVSSCWGLIERKMLPKAAPANAPVQTPAVPNKQRQSSKNGQESPRFAKLKEWWTELLKQAEKK